MVLLVHNNDDNAINENGMESIQSTDNDDSHDDYKSSDADGNHDESNADINNDEHNINASSNSEHNDSIYDDNPFI